MTLILNRSKLAVDSITGDQETVGLRIPSHPIALALLKQFESIGGNGVAAPSANNFGYVSPTSAHDVVNEIGSKLDRFDLVLEGGKCFIGIESTIIDCTRETLSILRPGTITPNLLRSFPNFKDFGSNNSHKVLVSGSLAHHYSPKAKILFNKTPLAGQGYIALSSYESPPGVIRLAAPKNLKQFAHVLYSSLRKADELGISEIAVELPAGNGIALAIRDRLIKAANKF
jgi:L-threonylcarbamoyladenylate synthase